MLTLPENPNVLVVYGIGTGDGGIFSGKGKKLKPDKLAKSFEDACQVCDAETS